jgi:hypothetical protein
MGGFLARQLRGATRHLRKSIWVIVLVVSCTLPVVFGQTVPSISLSSASGAPGQQVSVSGSGFSSKDTACSIITYGFNEISTQTCSITGGVVSGSFNVPNLSNGPITVAVVGAPAGDTAQATFIVEGSSSQPTTSIPIPGFVPLSLVLGIILGLAIIVLIRRHEADLSPPPVWGD